jgi:dTDP-4-dehydrorhamnose 3,5-epimerase
MKFEPTQIPDVVRIVPTVHRDPRGFFLEEWRAELLDQQGISATFVQQNLSRSVKGTLRGLHYQIEQPQGRLVRVVHGAVFDVAVDLRRSSPNFGQWTGGILSDENRHQLWVPPGFAHGFLVLTETADFQYNCTDTYAPEHERSIRWDDEDIGIDWPLEDGQVPIVSEKDSNAPSFREADTYS